MDPTALPPAVPFPDPHTPNQRVQHTAQDQASHAEPAPPVFDGEGLRAICDEILDRLLAALHRHYQVLPALNGILEDVVTRLSRIEASDRLDRAYQQHQEQNLSQLWNNLCNHADSVAANRSTAREQFDHYDKSPTLEENFTDNKQDDAVQVHRRTVTNSPPRIDEVAKLLHIIQRLVLTQPVLPITIAIAKTTIRLPKTINITLRDMWKSLIFTHTSYIFTPDRSAPSRWVPFYQARQPYLRQVNVLPTVADKTHGGHAFIGRHHPDPRPHQEPQSEAGETHLQRIPHPCV